MIINRLLYGVQRRATTFFFFFFSNSHCTGCTDQQEPERERKMDRRALWAVFRRRVTLVGLALSRIARRVTAAIIHRVRGCLSHRSHPPSDPLLPPLNGEIIKRAGDGTVAGERSC